MKTAFEYDRQIITLEKGVKIKAKESLVRATAVAAGAFALLSSSVGIEIASGKERAAQASAYGMNEAESDWCRWPSRWALCARAYELSKNANDAAVWTEQQTGWSRHNGGADAVRHCAWNGFMAYEFGRETASGFAWRHEFGEGQPEAEMNMDLHNNLRGRDWAHSVDIIQRCIDGVNSGELIRLEN